MAPLKVSLIGLRNAGRIFHLRSLSEFEDVDLSLCDIDPERLNAAGDEAGVPARKRYLDYRKMFAEEGTQAVVLSMAQYTLGASKAPPPYFGILNDILDRRLHVMVEKPLAMTVEEARPLAEKAARAGIVAMVNVNRRFNPLLQFCLEQVRARGPILTANCHFYKGKALGKYETGDWLTADMIHALDLLRYILPGEIADFHGAHSRLEGETRPTGFYAMATFEGGQTGFFSSNVRAGVRKEVWQIHGVGISAYIETARDQVHGAGMSGERLVKARIYRDNEFLLPRDYWSYHITGSDVPQVNSGFHAADRYFVDCVKSGTQPHCSFGDGLKTVAYCHRILSAREDVIRMPETASPPHPPRE